MDYKPTRKKLAKRKSKATLTPVATQEDQAGLFETVGNQTDSEQEEKERTAQRLDLVLVFQLPAFYVLAEHPPKVAVAKLLSEIASSDRTSAVAERAFLSVDFSFTQASSASVWQSCSTRR